MSERPKKIVADCSTGTVSELELTDAEIAQREADIAAFELALDSKKQAEEAKEVARKAAIAKLSALGLTLEEIQAL